MWSTVPSTWFFCPQSFANASNHLSYSGTKWLHCTMESDLVSASARETNGAARDGAEAAARVRPVCFRKRRRVRRKNLPVLIWIPPVDVASWRRLIQKRDQSSSVLDLADFNVTIALRLRAAFLLKPVTRYA